MERGVIVGADREQTIRFLPNYLITDAEIEQFISALDEACAHVSH